MCTSPPSHENLLIPLLLFIRLLQPPVLFCLPSSPSNSVFSSNCLANGHWRRHDEKWTYMMPTATHMLLNKTDTYTYVLVFLYFLIFILISIIFLMFSYIHFFIFLYLYGKFIHIYVFSNCFAVVILFSCSWMEHPARGADDEGDSEWEMLVDWLDGWLAGWSDPARCMYATDSAFEADRRVEITIGYETPNEWLSGWRW